MKERIKGADHWRTGTHHTEQTKQLLRQKKLGRNHPKFKGLFIIPAGTFESANQAAQAMNTTPKNIILHCQSKKWRHLGYNFIPKDEINDDTDKFIEHFCAQCKEIAANLIH